MTLVATFDAPTSRVDLVGSSIPELPGMDVLVERRTPEVTWTGVRNGFPAEVSAGAFQVFDYEFTPNVLNEYRARTDIFYDLFTRVSANSWGASTVGNTYTLVGGVAADFDVTGTRGEITGATAGVEREAVVNTLLLQDAKITADLGVSASPTTTASAQARLFGRRVDVNNSYFLQVVWETTGLVTMQLVKRVGGVDTAISASYATGLAYGTTVGIRAQLVLDGSRISGKVWATTADEPGLAQLSVIDTSITQAGAVSVAGRRSGTNANLIQYVDNFHAGDLATTSPQFTSLGTDDATPMQDTAWLKFPLRPFLNREISLCNWGDEVDGERGAIFEILGRRLPIAVTELQMSRAFPIVVKAVDSDEMEAIKLALSFGDVIFLQTPGPTVVCTLARRSYPEQGYFKVGTVTRSRPVDGRALWMLDIPLREVAPPDPTIPGSGVTWDGIVAAFATWNDVIAQFATWNDVLAYISDPEDEVVG